MVSQFNLSKFPPNRAPGSSRYILLLRYLPHHPQYAFDQPVCKLLRAFFLDFDLRVVNFFRFLTRARTVRPKWGAWAFNRVFLCEGLSAEVSHPPKKTCYLIGFHLNKRLSFYDYDYSSKTIETSQTFGPNWPKMSHQKQSFFRFLGCNSSQVQLRTPRPPQNQIFRAFLTSLTNF